MVSDSRAIGTTSCGSVATAVCANKSSKMRLPPRNAFRAAVRRSCGRGVRRPASHAINVARDLRMPAIDVPCVDCARVAAYSRATSSTEAPLLSGAKLLFAVPPAAIPGQRTPEPPADLTYVLQQPQDIT